MKKSGLYLLVALLLSPGSLAGQRAEKCGDSSSVVRGVVLNALTNQPAGRRGVSLLSQTNVYCSTNADSLGRYLFVGVEPGIYRVTVGYLGFRDFLPITVSVGPADTTTLPIRLTPGSNIDSCREVHACAEWLSPQRSSDMLEEDDFDATAFKAAAILTWRPLDRPIAHFLCIDTSSKAVLAALMRMHPKTASRSDCTRPGGDGVTNRARLVHTPSGEPAYALTVRVHGPPPTADRRIAEVSFYVAPLWAEGWECEFRRTPAGWEPVSCKMIWIS